jgi:hypothetical protein
MAGIPWTQQQIDVLRREYLKGTPAEQIGAMVGRRVSAVHNKAQGLGIKWGTDGFRVETNIPTPNRPLSDILNDQAQRYREKAARGEAKKGIDIKLEDDGPFALMFFGDPHADDDGCDLEKLCFDLNLAATTPNVHAANMGDLTNNWIRVLGHLYAHQHTTDDEAETLMDWLVGYLPWMFVILGNHDKWGPLAARICREHKRLYVSHGAVFNVWAGGERFKIDARHDHPGRSMYNPAHGQLKKNYRGSDADIIIGAHIHTSGYTMVRNGVTGKIGHAVRVGAYKRYDDFSDSKGFEDGAISPSVMCVCDPRAGGEGRITVFHDPEQGAKYLKALRGEI